MPDIRTSQKGVEFLRANGFPCHEIVQVPVPEKKDFGELVNEELVEAERLAREERLRIATQVSIAVLSSLVSKSEIHHARTLARLAVSYADDLIREIDKGDEHE